MILKWPIHEKDRVKIGNYDNGSNRTCSMINLPPKGREEIRFCYGEIINANLCDPKPRFTCLKSEVKRLQEGYRDKILGDICQPAKKAIKLWWKLEGNLWDFNEKNTCEKSRILETYPVPGLGNIPKKWVDPSGCSKKNIKIISRDGTVETRNISDIQEMPCWGSCPYKKWLKEQSKFLNFN